MSVHKNIGCRCRHTVILCNRIYDNGIVISPAAIISVFAIDKLDLSRVIIITFLIIYCVDLSQLLKAHTESKYLRSRLKGPYDGW